VQPHDLDAEESVLGATIASPNAVPIAVELLTANDFYRDTNRLIFGAVRKMYAAGVEVDPVTLSAALEQEGVLERVGGKDYVHTLVDVVPAATNVRHYAEIVRETSVLRRLIRAGQEIAELGYEHPHEAAALLDEAERKVYALADRDGGRGVVDACDSLRDLVESLPERRQGRRLRRVRCGFEMIDGFTGGLGRGELCLLGARPSIGKTSLATCIARSVAFNEGPVLFFSIEMSVEALTERLAQAHCLIGGDELRTGNLDGAQLDLLADLRERLAGGRLRIDDKAGRDPLRLRHVARRANAQAPLALVVVDYLQLMRSANRTENRQQEVAEISHSLKELALELDCPVLALSQLNRQVEGRGSEDGRPRLSDLRDSGALEQDADVVIFLHADKEQAKAARSGTLSVEVGAEVAKNRNGRIGQGVLLFERMFTRFRDKLPDR